MDLASFMEELPKLHYWNNAWQTGGLAREHLQLMVDLLSANCGPKGWSILESGAGNSTIAFLLAGAARVITVCPEYRLRDRILEYCQSNDIDTGPLQFHVAYSEWMLPVVADEVRRGGEPFDLALMDGGHGWPTVFTDFFYMNFALRKGGLLVTDDIQLHSVKELCRLLEEQPGFRRLEHRSKVIYWCKDEAIHHLPDFQGQPYITRMTEQHRAQGNHLSL